VLCSSFVHCRTFVGVAAVLLAEICLLNYKYRLI
jgi:hypothetical protein